MTVKNALLASSAGVGNPAAQATTKGKSKVEAEIERKNRGNKPEAVAQKPRDTRSDNAPHEHHHRHGDRGDDADPDGESLAGDILRGADAIAAFLGLDRRQAFHLLQMGVERGGIPAVKEGSTWTALKSRLRRHYNEGRYQPPAKRGLFSSAEE
jgi:hypothetical protein